MSRAMQKRVRTRVCLAALIFLAACASLPKPGAAPEITFQDRPKLQLNAARLEIEELQGATAQPVRSAVLNPADIARAWARRRLMTSGAAGVARLRILEASVSEPTLPATAHLGGYGTSAQERTLVARLRVELVLEGAGEGRRAFSDVTAQRRIRGARARNVIDAEYDALLDDLTRRFDNAMTAQTTAALTGF